MGWADLFGADNPFTQYVAANRGKLGQLGAGIASGQNLSAGLAAGVQGIPQGQAIDDAYATAQKAEAERQRQLAEATALKDKYTQFFTQQGRTDYAQAVADGIMEPGQAYGDWMKEQASGIGGAGGMEYGLTPIWGQFPDGSFGYGVQGKDGTFKAVDTGDLKPLDPRTLAGERAAGTVSGRTSAEAAFSAPGDIASAQTALDLINQIRNSPELPWATGTSAGLGGNSIPGTGRYGFQNLVEQAKSGAFLTAIQEMRGLGALSNTEGGAATQAITRMNTALSLDDFKKALADYEAIVQRGLDRARSRLPASSGGPQLPAAPQMGASGGADDPLGLR